MDRKIVKEVWKDIPGTTWHQISSMGNARTKDRKIFYRFKKNNKRKGKFLFLKSIEMKKGIGKAGYLYIYIKINGEYKNVSVARCVASAFHGKIYKGMSVNHINGIKTDNRVENLEIVTNKENTQHAWRTGLIKKANSGRYIFKEEDIRAIRFFYDPSKKHGSINPILCKIFGCRGNTLTKIAEHKTYKWFK